MDTEQQELHSRNWALNMDTEQQELDIRHGHKHQQELDIMDKEQQDIRWTNKTGHYT